MPLELYQGGPHSFHKFILNNTTIILIGDIHHSISSSLANEYLKVFIDYVQNNNVALFLEAPADSEKKKPSNDTKFIGTMRLLKPSNNLEIIFSDKRIEILDDKYVTLLAILFMLEDIKKSVEKKKPATKIKDCKSDLSPDIIHKIDSSVSHSSKCCTLIELIQFLASQIGVLDKLADRYKNVNNSVRDYIAACLLNLCDQIKVLEDLAKEYLAVYPNPDKNPLEKNLLQICADLIKKTGSFETVMTLQVVIDQYASSFHNATLLSDLWDKTLHNDAKKTFIAIAGDGHCEELIPILQDIGKQEISIFADNNGERIPPSLLSEFLQDNFDHAKKEKRSCSLM